MIKRILHFKFALVIIIIIVTLAAILTFGFWGPGGYRDLQKARRDLQMQKARVEDLKRSNSERMKSIEDLRSDKQALERYAREKGYGRNDEIIQQLPKKSDKIPESPSKH